MNSFKYIICSCSVPPSAAVITVEVWIIMPRSVACPPSQRNATTARASHTWWLSVRTRRWRPPQALRTHMRLPRPPRPQLGLTSAPQKRSSALARLPRRDPPLPPRNPTPSGAHGPKGGGNLENEPPTEVNSDRLTSWLSRLFSIKVTWKPRPTSIHPSSTSHLWRKLSRFLLSFILK